MTASLTSADGRHALVVDGRPLRLLAGELHNSAASCPRHLASVLDRAAELGCNAVIVPLSWELVEPAEGEWDLALVDAALAGCRARGMRLVPLWFGMYKNAHSSYAPAWVKSDLRRFPRAETAPGRRIGACSLFDGDEGLRADARAFARVMAHIRDRDRDGTAVAVQVENEVGLLGAPRDRSPAAEAAFAAGLPRELGQGAWESRFGVRADEAFMAWHFARYVGAVAAAGRAAHDLPAFANAWLVQHAAESPGEYPSGGPVIHMQEVWRAAAPAIQALAPDIYLDDFAAVCAAYARPDNPLIIPEARRDEHVSAKAWYAFGQHGALCYAPFGIESIGLGENPPIDGVVALAPVSHESTAAGAAQLAASYRLLRGLLPAIEAQLGTPRCRGLLQTGDEAQPVVLGGYRFIARWNRPWGRRSLAGGGLIASPRDGEFWIAGHGFRIEVAPATGPGQAEWLAIDEGAFAADGAWLPGRRLNGDEYGIRFGDAPGVRRARLHTY